MTSDSSDSPLVLTPDSTGSGIRGDSSPDSSAISLAAAASAKKTRRQTAFYPHMNSSNKPQKPFSRSAAKRESVMALGSIEHLQYFFTKTGLAAKKKCVILHALIIASFPSNHLHARPLDKAHLGLVPAIGGKSHVPSTLSITSISEVAPPVFPDPPKPLFPPHVKHHEVDPDSLLPGVIQDLVAVSKAWKLEKNKREEGSQDFSTISFDVLDVLKITTRAIRSTRNYLLSLPDDSSTDTLRAEVQFRHRMFGPRARVPSSSTPSLSISQKEPDSVARIRRSALEVLTVLRHLEEFYRLPLEDEAYDAHSDADHSRIIGMSSTPLIDPLDLPIEDDRTTNRSDYDPDMSISFSIVQVQGQYKSIPVWEDDDDDSSLEREEDTQKKDGWEERLVLGTGWLYRQDVKLGDLQTERAIVGSYLDIVDDVLFHGKPASELSASSERGWDRAEKQREWRASLRGARHRRVSAANGEGKSLGLGLDIPVPDLGGKRRVSTGMVDLVGRMRLTDEPEEMVEICEDEDADEEVNDEHLPEWARRSAFVDDRLGQGYLFFFSYFLSEADIVCRSCSCPSWTLIAPFLETLAGTPRFKARFSPKSSFWATSMCGIQYVCSQIEEALGVRQQRRNTRYLCSRENRVRKWRRRGW